MGDTQARLEMAERMKSARIRKGYSQPEMAILASRCVRTISRWEAGDTVPTVDELRKWCELTSHNFAWILTGKGRRTAPVCA